MKLEKPGKDQMTPVERRQALREGKQPDRVPAVPFMGELKCGLCGITVWEFWHDAEKMAEAERAAFNRFGYDRIVIGPNTRGITEALGGKFVYPKDGLPYADRPLIDDYEILKHMEPAEAGRSERIGLFRQELEMLQEEATDLVPVEISIGGPFTIASNLRGVERLLRDCRRAPGEIHRLLRIITDTQKSCIDMAAACGAGIAMADPVANPALIGPKMYEKFVYPVTRELTEYAVRKTGQGVSLHMCGATYSIWKYLGTYPLHELSLDNIIDFERAAAEIGSQVPIAGNVDPVEVVLNGTREDIFRAVKRCVKTGSRASEGFTLATGCDIPETADPVKVDWFMDAARKC